MTASIDLFCLHWQTTKEIVSYVLIATIQTFHTLKVVSVLDIIFFNCKICWKHSHLLRHKDDISDPFKIFPVKEQVYFTDQHKEITFVSCNRVEKICLNKQANDIFIKLYIYFLLNHVISIDPLVSNENPHFSINDNINMYCSYHTPYPKVELKKKQEYILHLPYP
jgi:hypothetical protein